MITAKFFFDKNGEVVGFDMNGHSGSAVSGEDIVCAAVSSAVFMTVNTLTDVAKVKANLTSHPDGHVYFMLQKDERSEIACQILEGLLLHMEGLEEQYRDYIRVFDTEV